MGLHYFIIITEKKFQAPHFLNAIHNRKFFTQKKATEHMDTTFLDTMVLGVTVDQGICTFL